MEQLRIQKQREDEARAQAAASGSDVKNEPSDDGDALGLEGLEKRWRGDALACEGEFPAEVDLQGANVSVTAGTGLRDT